MGKEIITFGNVTVDKYKFYQHKSLILMYDVSIDRKRDDLEQVMPLCILLS